MTQAAAAGGGVEGMNDLPAAVRSPGSGEPGETARKSMPADDVSAHASLTRVRHRRARDDTRGHQTTRGSGIRAWGDTASPPYLGGWWWVGTQVQGVYRFAWTAIATSSAAS
jgi:hypothetical protein